MGLTADELTLKISFDQFVVDLHRRKIGRRADTDPARRERYQQELKYWTDELKPHLFGNRELWYWRQSKVANGRIGIAVVEDGQVIEAWMLAHVL